MNSLFVVKEVSQQAKVTSTPLHTSGCRELAFASRNESDKRPTSNKMIYLNLNSQMHGRN